MGANQNRDPVPCPVCGVVSHILNVKGIYTCIGPESCPVYTFEYDHKHKTYGPYVTVGPDVHVFGTPLEKRLDYVGPIPLISEVKFYATEHRAFMELLK